MKLFGSKSYVKAPPAPKMPQGLIELMEGLTKEVLKNNPTEVYEFCAEHMRKLLELRDHDRTPKRCLTLEQKVLKATNIIRQRAEKRREKYDNDMQILQQTEHLIDSHENKGYDTECLSMKADPNIFDDNSKRDDEHLDSTATRSEPIVLKETSEIFDNVPFTSEVAEKNTDENEEQVKSDNQLNGNIDNITMNPIEHEDGGNNKENAIVADSYNKEDYPREIDTNGTAGDKEENIQVKSDMQENLDIQSKDQSNDDPSENELAEETHTDKCEEIENDKLTYAIDSDDKAVATEDLKVSQILDTNSQINTMQEIANDDVNGHNNEDEINVKYASEKTGIDCENNQSEIEDGHVEAGTNSEIMQVELEEISETDKCDQNSIKEETAINGNQKQIEQSACSDEGDWNEVKNDEKNNLKEVEVQPVSNEEDNKNEIKNEVVMNEENNKKELEQQLVSNKKDDQIEPHEDADIKVENNQMELLSSTTDKGEIKEIIEQVAIPHKNEQNESAIQENDRDDVEKQIDTNSEQNQTKMEAQSSSNNENGKNEINEQGDIIFITEVKADIDSEQGNNKETITIINEEKRDESVTNHDKPVFESTDVSNDKPKDELDVVKDDGNERNAEYCNVVTNILISSNIEPELASHHAVPGKGTVSNSDQPLTRDPDEDEIIDKPLIINIDLQQNNQGTSHNNQSKAQSIDECSGNGTVECKESGAVESKNSKPMDLETAAITIQKVFRNFLFRSKTSSFDDSTNIEFNIFGHETDSKDVVYSHQSPILIKDKRPMGISRMDTVLQTVNEEKSLSLSTDDSSTLSSAATVIQAHIRGFLVRNRLNRNKTISSTSLADSDDPPASLEADPDPAKNKTVLNIHIVPEGSHFLSRDESMLTSVELSLDGSPPASSNLHPLGYDKNERRKRLKREDAVQSISPPSNNSTRLSEEHDSVKEILFNDDKNKAKEALNDDLPVESKISEDSDSDSDDVLSKGTVEEKEIETPEPATTSDQKTGLAKVVSSDELDVITPFENIGGKNGVDSDNNRLVHSGEFHDVVLPTKVSRNDTSVVRDFQNVLVYFLAWNNS